ncbi:MAG TPA: glycosyltransferase family 39 protein [Candidatus Dormibacteraeota bacterium]|nr:glycosyltransferase family 39 protein [Candidatus Dormibacteraeota bacterium]
MVSTLPKPPSPWDRVGGLLVSPATIILVAFIVRLAVIIAHAYQAPPIPTDHIQIGYEVGRVAQSIAEGHGFSSPLNVDSGPTAWFTPVYPYILASVFKIFGVFTNKSYLAILIFNSLCSALTCLPIGMIGNRLFGRPTGAVSAWMWAFLQTAIFFPTQWVWDTSLSALLVATLIWATYAVRESGRMRSWVAYGALWAFVILTNPSVLVLLPFFLAWLAIEVRYRATHWKRLIAVSALVLFAGVTPWLVRNYLAFNKLALFRSNFGLELYLGNNPEVPNSWSWWLHPNDNDQERQKFLQMGEIPYMAEKQRLAIDFIRTHPADFLRFVFHRFADNWFGTWEAPLDVMRVQSWPVRGTIIWNCTFAFLTFFGLWLANRLFSREVFPLAISIIVFPVVYYVSHSSLRYRHPIDPVMTIYSAFFVVHCIASLARRSTVRTRLPAAS